MSSSAPSVLEQPPLSIVSPFQLEDYFNLDFLTEPIATSDAGVGVGADIAAASSSRSAGSTGSSPSRSSSHSPSTSSVHLPPTPPHNSEHEPTSSPSLSLQQQHQMPSFDFSSFGSLPAIDEESIFNYASYDPSMGFGAVSGIDFLKPGSDPLAGLSHSPYDLFGSFDAGLDINNNSSTGKNNNTSNVSVNGNYHTTTTTSSSSSSGRSARSVRSSIAPDPPAFSFAIDPQLVGTPAPSSRGDDESEDEQEKDEESELEEAYSARGDIAAGSGIGNTDELVLTPVKVGGKGKARRGTLHSGGVVKKTGSVVPVGPQSIFGSLSNGERKSKSSKDDMDADDWRPSPEEYQKMSSKEKRQLRNKISARNFRVRRKEYIHTLEGDIAERDHLIDAIRAELGTSRSENYALRQEVTALKKAILEGRASPMLPPPAPLSPLSPLSTLHPAGLPSSSLSTNSNSSNNLMKPNIHKDLPASPRLAAIGGSGAFWGGQAGSTGLGAFSGGITPVHTALIPETTFNAQAHIDRANENMNPLLNHLPAPSASKVLSQLGINSGFDSFSDINPFTIKMLDPYRMQLWNRIAMQAQQQRVRANQSPLSPNVYPSPSSHTSTSNSLTNSPTLHGLASMLRPHYFSSSSTGLQPTSPTNKSPFSSLLPGKATCHDLPSPPLSQRSSEKERQSQLQQRSQQQQAQHALLASLACHTMLHKMGQVFWDAFSGNGSSCDQVHASISGTNTAGLHTPPTLRTWDAEKVRRVLEGTAELRVVDIEPRKALAHAIPTGSPSSKSTDALEESMRSLSLSSASSSPKEDEKKEKKCFWLNRGKC